MGMLINPAPLDPYIYTGRYGDAIPEHRGLLILYRVYPARHALH